MVYEEMNKDLTSMLDEMGQKAKIASSILNTVSSEQKNKFFDLAVESIQKDTDKILEANHADIQQAKENKKDDAFICLLYTSDATWVKVE